MYEDALTEAEKLQGAIAAPGREAGDATLEAARSAWLAARVPYQQTEVYRFGNPIVDDWEGKVNAWPLDEGLIDYVAASYGEESDINDLLHRQRDRESGDHGERRDARRVDHRCGPVALAARDRRGRGQCRDRLPRDRVPAVGPGPERHRRRRRHPPGDRLRSRQLHRRQLRPARCLPDHRRRHGGHATCRRWSATGARAARRAPP